MVHSGGGILWLEVLLQHEIGGCGHIAGGVAVCGGRTHAPAGGRLLACRFAIVRRLLHFVLHRRVPTTGGRRGFTFLSLVLRFGFLLCLLAAFPLHPPVLEPDLDLRLREHEAGSDFEALGSGQILVLSELFFQLQQLLTGEGCARPPCLAEEGVLRAATCEVGQPRVKHAGPRQPLKLHVLKVLLVPRGDWAAARRTTTPLRTARCRLQRVERRPSRQKMVVMVVMVTVNSVVIQVILVMIGSEERRSDC